MTTQHTVANHAQQRHSPVQGQRGVSPRFPNNSTLLFRKHTSAF